MNPCFSLRRAALGLLLAGGVAGSATPPSRASSHMDAPLITLDDPANTTDVYAFVSGGPGRTYLSTALAVYPFEEPGIGPNAYRFDDSVRYEIHVCLGDDLRDGRATLTYRFEFQTRFRDRQTILQSFRGVVENLGDPAQNLIQRYEVTRVDHRTGREVSLGSGRTPPNNQGRATPHYNQDSDGDRPARDGVGRGQQVDRYTKEAVARLDQGYRAFAGQRDDGFYADIQAVFDLLSFRDGDDSFDSQGGYNVHTIALDIPLSELGGEMQVAGVYATTSRRTSPVLRDGARDRELFARYAARPELARLINILLLGNSRSFQSEVDRSDLVAIFIPDVIKVDLSTGPVRLAGGGPDHATNPDDAGFHRLGIFGGDTLLSQVQEGFGGGVVPGGWPNGRRFGDDVLDVAVSAVLSDLRDPTNPTIRVADGIDNVDRNDIAFNKVFPYAATPLNGRHHGHH